VSISCIDDSDADVGARTVNDDTPLHLAALRGHEETAKLLLRKGADCSAVNRQNQTPAQEAFNHKFMNLYMELAGKENGMKQLCSRCLCNSDSYRPEIDAGVERQRTFRPR
jgi:ankyrin repeat protein